MRLDWRGTLSRGELGVISEGARLDGAVSKEMLKDVLRKEVRACDGLALGEREIKEVINILNYLYHCLCLQSTGCSRWLSTVVTDPLALVTGSHSPCPHGIYSPQTSRFLKWLDTWQYIVYRYLRLKMLLINSLLTWTLWELLAFVLFYFLLFPFLEIKKQQSGS